MALFHVFSLAEFSVAAALPGFVQECREYARVIHACIYVYIYIDKYVDFCLCDIHQNRYLLYIYVVSCRQISNIDEIEMLVMIR